MRRRRVPLFLVPLLLGVALLALWLVPPQLDWSRYRTAIAQFATARLGLPVSIDGPVSLRLLPEPVLTAAKVSVGNAAQDGMQIRVQALRLRLGLLPLLTGRIDARALVLQRPDLHIPWPARSGTLHVGPPLGLTAFSARIEDGSLSVGQFPVTHISGSIASLRSDALTAHVGATLAGQSWHAELRLSRAGMDGAADLSVALQGEGKAAHTTASFIGRLDASGAVAGRVTASGRNLSLLLPAPALRFQAKGRLTVADGLAEADELKAQLAGAPVSAAVALRVLPRPRLDIALSATRLDIDPWLPLLTWQPARTRLLPIGLDISAGAATLGGAMLRHLRATIELVPGAELVRQLSAKVPGDASIALAGRINRAAGAGPFFIGTGQLHAPVLRNTLRWMLPRAAAELAALPPEVGQQADLAGKVVLQRDRIRLSELHGEVDGNALTGSVDWKAGAPPAVAADLRLDHMRLGPWLGTADTQLRQIVLHELDTGLRLQVNQASLHGIAIGDLTLDAATIGGAITLHRLQATVQGARLTASGSVDAKGAVSAGHLLVTTGNAMSLSELLPVAWRATPALWFGPAKLEVTASGPRQAVASNIGLHLGDLRLRWQPVVNLATGAALGWITAQDPNAQRLISDFGLPARLGLDGVPVWLGQGSLSLVAQLGVGPGRRVSLEHGVLVAGGLRARLDLVLNAAGSEPVLTGSVAAETLKLPMPGAGPLPFALLHDWQADLHISAGEVLGRGVTLLRDANADVRLQHKALSLDLLSARLGGGTLAARLSLDDAQQPPSLALQGKLSGATIDAPVLGLPIDVVSGKADLSLSLRATGYSTAALTAGLSGTVQAQVADGTLSGFDLAGLRDRLQQSASDPTEQSLHEALDAGQTPFQQLTLQGEVAHGILSLASAKLTGTAGMAVATGSVALTDASADLHLVLRPAIPQGPSIAVLLSGKLDAPTRTPELAGVTRWWSGRVH